MMEACCLCCTQTEINTTKDADDLQKVECGM